MKLNVGGQQSRDRFPDGWVFVDLLPAAEIVMDISKNLLPIKEEAVTLIYFSHCLEHIWPHRYDFVLRELFRVLNPGGKMRVVVPNMDIVIEKYSTTKNSESPEFIQECFSWWFDYGINKDGKVRLNHLGGFNWSFLEHVVQRNGFKNIVRKSFGDYSNGFDDCDNPGHEATSLYLECVKNVL